MSIRILLCDDHSILRESLSRSLQAEADLEVVGEAANGLVTVELARTLAPDVIVMDISMPDLNGIEATRQILRDCPDANILALSMHSSHRYVREMFKAGASGYVLKNVPLEELARAIRLVAAGKTYICPEIGHVLVEDCVGRPDEDPSVFRVLTTREREVLQLMAEGNTTKQIALKLHISPKTVEAHRRNIVEKVGIDNVAQLTKYAIQEGLTESDI